MAAVDPASLPNLITKDADGDYVVTLYGPQGQHSLKVDDELPVNSTSMFTGAWSSDPQQALWLGLVEKAVIEDSAIGDTFITGINDDSYAATDAGGFASQAMRTLTGVEHTFCNVASLSPDGDGIAQITSALNEHHLVIFNSHIQNAFGLLTGHSYATVGCDADGNFELVNPQGMNAGAQCPAIVKLSAAQLFSLAGLGNEAQNANEGFDIEAAAPNIGQQANLLVEAMAGSASQPSASTGSHLVQPPEMRTGGVLASSPLMAQPAG
jgi:hypothetical protein